MGRIRFLGAIIGLLLSAAASAEPQDHGISEQSPPPDGVMFLSVLPLKQKGASAALRDGKEAVSEHWPASLYAFYKVNGQSASCTAALVGPRAVLTAAHCVPRAGRISFVFNDRTYDAACTISPRYGEGRDRDRSADYALCEVQHQDPRSLAYAPADVVTPKNFSFERVDTVRGLAHFQQQAAAGRGVEVILTGFGCKSDFVADRFLIDGTYRIGSNKVVETSQTSARRRAANYYQPAQLNNLITSNDPEKANLCPGDSGGPAYIVERGFPDYSRRKIVAINSAVFFADPDRVRYDASLLSATATPDFTELAARWLATPGREICGIKTSPALEVRCRAR